MVSIMNEREDLLQRTRRQASSRATTHHPPPATRLSSREGGLGGSCACRQAARLISSASEKCSLQGTNQKTNHPLIHHTSVPFGTGTKETLHG